MGDDVNDDLTGDMTQRDLDEVDDLAARIAVGAPIAPPPPLPAPTRRPFDPGSLIVGAWFVLVGLLAAVLGPNLVEDLPPIVIPISFAVTGLGLLLPKRPARAREPRDW